MRWNCRRQRVENLGSMAGVSERSCEAVARIEKLDWQTRVGQGQSERRGLSVGEGGTGGSGDEDPLWYESMPDDWSWAFLWSGYVHRCMCGGIRTIDLEAQCSACGKAWVEVEPAPLVTRDTDGHELRVKPDLAGAEGRYEDWVYLSMLEREWRDSSVRKEAWRGRCDGTADGNGLRIWVRWQVFRRGLARLSRGSRNSIGRRALDKDKAKEGV